MIRTWSLIAGDTRSSNEDVELSALQHVRSESQALVEDEISELRCQVAKFTSASWCYASACIVAIVLISCLMYHALALFVAGRHGGTLSLAQALWTDTSDYVCDGVGKDPTAIVVVSYNLFWWCTSDRYGTCKQNADGKGLDGLATLLRHNHPFDLIGFQECDDVWQLLARIGYEDCLEAYGPGNDIPMVWNNQKYGWISNGNVKVAIDKWGDRYVNWVRLSVRATGKTLFFANTHGPLQQCDGDVGKQVADNYANAILANKQPEDAVIFAGDFNCGSYTDTIARLGLTFANDGTDNSYGGSDHIFSSGLPVLWGGTVAGTPSDHELLKVTLRLPGQVIAH